MNPAKRISEQPNYLPLPHLRTSSAETSTENSEIVALKSHIITLQEKLRQAEKELRNYDQLLKNARLRECELRSELAQRKS